MLRSSKNGRKTARKVPMGGCGADSSDNESGNKLYGVCRGGKVVKNGGGLARFRPVDLREIEFLCGALMEF